MSKNLDELDWDAFSKAFKKREGFSPTRSDSRAEECFFYFTAGAHYEFVGHPNEQPEHP